MGISKKESSQAQKLANLSPEVFAEVVAGKKTRTEANRLLRRSEAGVLHQPFHAAQISSMFRRQITRRLQHRAMEIGLAAQAQVALRQQVEPLLRRHPRQVAHPKRWLRRALRRMVSLQIDA